MYKNIENAIRFAMQETRYTQRECLEHTEDEQDKKECWTILNNVLEKLQEAIDEMPF